MSTAAITPDPYAAYGGSVAPTSAPAPNSDPYAAYGGSVAPAPTALSANPKGEGTYAMVGNDGNTTNIPYSKVQAAASAGARFPTREVLQQYARDRASDPASEDSVDKYIDGLSWYNPARLARDTVAGIGTGAMKTLTGLDHAPRSHGVAGRIEQTAQIAAATPTKGVVQGAGEMAENVGEWFTGEELLGLLGKAGEGMSIGEKLKSATGLADTIAKYPLVGKLIKVGSSAVKQGVIGAGQTYAKTGDVGAAAKTGAVTAAISPVAEGIASRVSNMGSAAAAVGLPSLERYANEARAAVEPYIQQVAQAMDAQGGTAAAGAGTAADGAASADAAAAPTPGSGTASASNGTNPGQGGGAAPNPAAAPQPSAGSRGVYDATATPINRAGSAVAPYGTDEGLATRTGVGPYQGPAEDGLATRTGIGFSRGSVVDTAAPGIGSGSASPALGVGSDMTASEGSNPSAAQPSSPLATRTGMATTDAAAQGAASAPRATAQAAARQASSFNVAQVLSTIHDFNGAKDRLAQVAAPMYDVMDQVTGGKFRVLNEQVSAAQKAVYKSVAGTPERNAAESLLDSRQQQMSDLIDSTHGKVSPEIVAAAKGTFRQSYVLNQFATIWDRNLGVVPGGTTANPAASINGKGLMKDLTSAVNKKGRPYIESVMGPGALDNLESIARENLTAPKRAAFSGGIRAVARSLEKGAVLGGVAGAAAGAEFHTGAVIGAAAMGATYIPDVLNAVGTNPKIGKFLTSAIQMGARPEVYGPIVANMIQATQPSRGAQQ